MSYTLVVDVVSASILSGSRDSHNLCVELRFAGRKQRPTNSVKNKDRHLEWNERFRFDELDKDKVVNGTLEAYVYNDVAGRRSFIGRVRLSGSTFADCAEHAEDHPLRGGIFPRSKGTLHLKVVLTKENPIENEDPISRVVPSRDSLRSRRVSREPFNPVGAEVKEIKPTFEHGMIVEHMPYVFVRVVKARRLAVEDARGRLYPYVDVKFGDSTGTTKDMAMDKNLERDTSFAFSRRNSLTIIYVIVKHLDMAGDEFVGMVWFDVSDIPCRFASDKGPVPQWRHLVDERGDATEGELMLAVWRGSQADEAFPDAWKPDSHIGPRVYDLPLLCYLRVQIIELKCVAVARGAEAVELYVKLVLGDQILRSRYVKAPLGHHFWNEEFMFVAAEPFVDMQLQISVQEHNIDSTDMVVGQIAIPLQGFQKRVNSRLVDPKYFPLEMPPKVEAEGGSDEPIASSCRIRLRKCLEDGYSVQYDSTDCADDFRPAAKEISDPPPIGLLEIGILRAKGLHPRTRINGESTLNPYIVAKYGKKWVRTRTIMNTCNPEFNEQYKWDVYDTATVLTIGVFDHGQLEGYGPDEDSGSRIGKVRILLSYLQPGRTYAHSYPLLVLRPSGVKVLGELHLAVRFSSKSVVELLRMYFSPKLPKMHYENKLSIIQQENLRHHAVQIVASRFSRMEPPLWEEVVEYMCDVRSHLWSMRKSKASFFRIMSVFSFLFQLGSWFVHVRSWKNPATTLLVHAIFVLALLFHRLILPSVLIYAFFVTLWNYRWRPTCLPHPDTRISYAEVHPDELDEEFDTFPTSRPSDIVRMRYDRLRSVAGRVQTVVGDCASYGERIQSLATWRDPTATAIFALFTLAAAILLYFTPWEILVGIAGFYTMRHPVFRRETRMPSFLENLFCRLPQKTGMLF